MATRLPIVVDPGVGLRQIATGDSIPVAAGGTGATDAAGARTNLGIGNVENKSSSQIRGELTSSDITTALGYTPAAGAGAIYTATIDFGSNPVTAKSFQIANASVTTTNKVIAMANPDSDEYEMDGLLCSGYCKVNGTITLFVTAVPGPIRGIRKIIYWLG